MKKRTLFWAIACMALTTACGGQKPEQKAPTQSITTTETDPSTTYGLACDGCNDTIAVVLRDIDAAPDTFNILDAMRQRKVFGRPQIGDKLALVLNADDSTKADIVIDLEVLKGTWCYEVMPTLRRRPGMTEAQAKQMMEHMPDSLKEEMMEPREYGFTIKADNEMTPIGTAYRGQTSDEKGPFEYPKLKRYRQWRLVAGRLILTETRHDSLGNVTPTSSDTADLIRLHRDTLVLRFAEGDQKYYRKQVQN